MSSTRARSSWTSTPAAVRRRRKRPAPTPRRPLRERKEKAKEYWEKARTITPGTRDEESGISACQLGGSTQFMMKEQCLARGGVPK